MITCNKCGTTQPAGNFCGSCGNPISTEETTPIVEQTPIQPTSATPPPGTETVQQAKSEPVATPNATIETLKQQTGNYWNYFLETLKHPSKMGDTRYFNFGLISTILSLVLYSLIPIVFTNKMIDRIYGFANSLSDGYINGSSALGVGTFIKIFLYMGIFYVLLIAIILFLSRQFGMMKNFKKGIAQLGAFNNFLNVAFIVSLVLLLLNSITFATILYCFISLIFVYLVPLFLASHYFMQHPKKDAFTSFLMTIVATVVYIVIYYAIFFDKIANDIDLPNLFDSMSF